MIFTNISSRFGVAQQKYLCYIAAQLARDAESRRRLGKIIQECQYALSTVKETCISRGAGPLDGGNPRLRWRGGAYRSPGADRGSHGDNRPGSADGNNRPGGSYGSSH